MREWKITNDGPHSLVLAADARLSSLDYCDDQIWELTLGGGEPPAVALQSTYGLRARNMRLFPQFIEEGTIRGDPGDFSSQPEIRLFYPNFLEIFFSPFQGIDVTADYWVPYSQAVCGRLQIANISSIKRRVTIELVALLTPADNGQPMSVVEMRAAQVLVGRSGDLSPLVFMTGGPDAASGPYPALSLEVDLSPGSLRSITWCHVAAQSAEESFDQARLLAAKTWDAEKARIELLNSSNVEIHTGDPDWDAALAFSQKVALGSLLGPTSALPHTSFVITRLPDQGYSIRGDGSDYGPAWNGQSPLETYYLIDFLLPGFKDIAKGLLLNFLSTQTEDGFVDFKPGLGGQTSTKLATPLLATLAWRIHQVNEDLGFLSKVYPGLVRYLFSWFTDQHDRDGDGIPEWDHPVQAGYEDHPLFSHWHHWAQGIDINVAESPALCAFLYRECQALIQIARSINQLELIPSFYELADELRTAVELSWDEQRATYHNWDRDTHLTTTLKVLGKRRGPGRLNVQRNFKQPARLLLRVHADGESTRHPIIFLHGTGASGNRRIERISSDQFNWYLGLGTATCEKTYHSIDYLEIKGLDEKDHISLQTANFSTEDHTLLLPLWAGIPDKDRAELLLKNTLTNPERYWRSYGLPACPAFTSTPDAHACQYVHPIWNSFIGEGLINYGFQEAAIELINRLMQAVIRNLKQKGAFRRFYNAESGEGFGDRDSISGLAPLGLFMTALGVRIISQYKVAVTGFNPFPWPVTVKYKGLTILRHINQTRVIFPDGQTIKADDPLPRVISLE